MKRTHHDPNESLELLLDTICNMFGSIIFVALIAALLAMTSSRGNMTSELSQIDSERGKQVASLRTRADELDRELSKQPAPAESNLGEGAVDRVEKAIVEISRRQALIQQYSEALATSSQSFEGADIQLEPLREEIARLDEALASATSAQNRKMRTPLERELGLRIFTVVLWKDRLYPICDWTDRSLGGCELLRRWDDRYVFANRCSTPLYRCEASGIEIHRSIELRPNAGIPITSVSELHTNAEFIRLLATLDASADLIGFTVAPDSFDTFAVVKEAFLRKGFNYNLDISPSMLPHYNDSWISGISSGL